jgi:hypothetical protein
VDVFPIAFLPENHALAIAIMSYDGGINFGLLADHDSMEDVDAIGTALEREIEALLRAARAAARARAGTEQARATRAATSAGEDPA